ncbi:MAG: PIN domain-containing protein [Defluviitaleaceae bacterium]|nr:PIN domain-containing protein [Defluviitaleaceae bacterium]
MIYALDTNTISFLLRQNRNPEVRQRFEEIIEKGDKYVIPPICHYEINWYLLRKNATAQLQVFNDLYAESSATIVMDEAEFIKAAEIRAELEARGLSVGNKDADIFIAAHCIVNCYTLVTDNVSDFERIDGLSIVNWKA